MADQPKVTISFTLTLYQAALHMALYDLMNTEIRDYDDLAPQTTENYAVLVDEITDKQRMDAVVIRAGNVSDESETSLVQFLMSRVGYTTPSE